MTFHEITKQVHDAVRELLETARLEKGDIFMYSAKAVEMMGSEEYVII